MRNSSRDNRRDSARNHRSSALAQNVLGERSMPTLNGVEAEDADELPPDSQFESFYDEDSGTWTLRRIPSSPPAAVVDPD